MARWHLNTVNNKFKGWHTYTALLSCFRKHEGHSNLIDLKFSWPPKSTQIVHIEIHNLTSCTQHEYSAILTCTSPLNNIFSKQMKGYNITHRCRGQPGSTVCIDYSTTFRACRDQWPWIDFGVGKFHHSCGSWVCFQGSFGGLGPTGVFVWTDDICSLGSLIMFGGRNRCHEEFRCNPLIYLVIDRQTIGFYVPQRIPMECCHLF